MWKLSLNLMLFILFLSASSCSKKAVSEPNQSGLTARQELGKLLFFDETLSTPPGQSCAGCHHPDFAFADPKTDLPVSQGAHDNRFGNRNDLTAMYAAHVPELHYDEVEEVYIGGLFWDGRVNTLEEQAKGPPLNPLEMANPNAEALIASIRASDYTDLFKSVFGKKALDDNEKVFDYFAQAIADYERSKEFNPFSSKYDYYLRGEISLTNQEMRGLALFNDESKGNCAACHPSKPADDGTPPLFTDFTYDNLGVPKNPENPFYYLSEDLNPDGTGYIDLGLGGFLNKEEEYGKFRVPTLRNVALTAPYMHNGVFQTLYQTVMFYNTRDIGPWPKAEVKINVNKDELGNLGLTTNEVLDIIAFMNTLTDGYKLE